MNEKPDVFEQIHEQVERLRLECKADIEHAQARPERRMAALEELTRSLLEKVALLQGRSERLNVLEAESREIRRALDNLTIALLRSGPRAGGGWQQDRPGGEPPGPGGSGEKRG